jgi:hypothetical protein
MNIKKFAATLITTKPMHLFFESTYFPNLWKPSAGSEANSGPTKQTFDEQNLGIMKKNAEKRSVPTDCAGVKC